MRKKAEIGQDQNMSDESQELQGERLARFLAHAGVASRRHAEELIAAGRWRRSDLSANWKKWFCAPASHLYHNKAISSLHALYQIDRLKAISIFLAT